MNKRIEKFLLWDHLCPVVSLLSTVAPIIQWIKGQGTPWTGVFIGWGFGCAVFWQFYLGQRKRTDLWMDRAIKLTQGDMPKLLDAAKHLVEARILSENIDPDRN